MCGFWCILNTLDCVWLLVILEKDKTILSDFIGFKETLSVVSLNWTLVESLKGGECLEPPSSFPSFPLDGQLC